MLGMFPAVSSHDSDIDRLLLSSCFSKCLEIPAVGKYVQYSMPEIIREENRFVVYCM